MKNKYSKEAEKKIINRAKREKVPKDLALSVYISNLLGVVPKLVLHGGGNISVKFLDDTLYIKSSGSNLGIIEASGFTALDLTYLLKLRSRDSFSDWRMVKSLKSARLDPDALDPSVETLFHAFLDHKFIVHTHANAVLALTNQSDGEKRCKRVFGDKVGVMPYAMSGFDLAKKAAVICEKKPNISGLVVMRHGLFTFGRTAKEAYDEMIRLVTLAELEIRNKRRNTPRTITVPAKLLPVSEINPIIRGALGPGWLLDFRSNKSIRNFLLGKDLARYGTAGPATPDHVIWVKPKPLVLPIPDSSRRFSIKVHQAVERFEDQYKRYFVKQNIRHNGKKNIRDPKPRVVLVKGLGLLGVGQSLKSARIAADLATVNIDIITNAEAIGHYRPAKQADIFDIEYWPPETTKLTRLEPLPMEGKIVLITGAGSGIGAATAKAFSDQGAVVIAVDINKKSAEKIAKAVGGLGLYSDVTKPKDVRRVFDTACKVYGGVDVVVSNAGAAWQGEIGSVDDEIVRKSFELNFFSHQSVAQNAIRVMRAQNFGGCLLFNASKQAVNPGADFGPYGLPKAATLFLMRQYAVDHGKDGITSNAVNADRIRSGLLTDSMISKRSEARKLSELDYMGGNLLGVEVTASDVAKAFVDLALSPKTTAAVITVDGGNIAAAPR